MRWEARPVYSSWHANPFRATLATHRITNIIIIREQPFSLAASVLSFSTLPVAVFVCLPMSVTLSVSLLLRLCVFLSSFPRLFCTRSYFSLSWSFSLVFGQSTPSFTHLAHDASSHPHSYPSIYPTHPVIHPPSYPPIRSPSNAKGLPFIHPSSHYSFSSSVIDSSTAYSNH